MFSAATGGLMAHQCGLLQEEWGSAAAFFIGVVGTPSVLKRPLFVDS